MRYKQVHEIEVKIEIMVQVGSNKNGTTILENNLSVSYIN